MNYINLFGTYYNTDHFKMICPSSRINESPSNHDWFPCVYLYERDGTSKCATNYANLFKDEKAAKQSAERSLVRAFKDFPF